MQRRDPNYADEKLQAMRVYVSQIRAVLAARPAREAFNADELAELAELATILAYAHEGLDAALSVGAPLPDAWAKAR